MTERQAEQWMETKAQRWECWVGSAAGRWEKRLTRARESRPLPWAGLGLVLWCLGKGKSLAARLAAFLLAGGLTALLGRARP